VKSHAQNVFSRDMCAHAWHQRLQHHGRFRGDEAQRNEFRDSAGVLWIIANQCQMPRAIERRLPYMIVDVVGMPNWCAVRMILIQSPVEMRPGEIRSRDRQNFSRCAGKRAQ
jgi:hypothetical protein